MDENLKRQLDKDLEIERYYQKEHWKDIIKDVFFWTILSIFILGSLFGFTFLIVYLIEFLI